MKVPRQMPVAKVPADHTFLIDERLPISFAVDVGLLELGKGTERSVAILQHGISHFTIVGAVVFELESRPNRLRPSPEMFQQKLPGQFTLISLQRFRDLQERGMLQVERIKNNVPRGRVDELFHVGNFSNDQVLKSRGV